MQKTNTTWRKRFEKEFGERLDTLEFFYQNHGGTSWEGKRNIPDFIAQELLNLCNEFEEIIGKDETPESYMPKLLTEKELSMAHQAVQFHARNKVRTELREKLRKLKENKEVKI